MKNILTIFCVLVFQLNVCADDYYWVGGSGLWSDINNWATTSGGSVLYNQPPTANNTVIFDQNSFPSTGGVVSINLKNAVCRDMIWSGVVNSPTLVGADTSSLRIYGSLILDPGMNFNYLQTVYFEAVTPGKQILGAGHTFQCDIVFQGYGGGWELQDDFRSYNPVILLHGSFNTNGNRLECSSFTSPSGEQRAIQLGSSEIITGSWSVNGLNLLLEAAQSRFFVSNSFSNTNGTRLIYNRLRFTDPYGSMMNENVSAVFTRVEFNDGSVSGDFVVDSLIFLGAAEIQGNDSINYLYIAGPGTISGGINVIGYLEGNNFCRIAGDNIIDSVLVAGNSEIIGSNTMNVVLLGSNAVIEGSNVFSHLVITRQASVWGENTIRWALLNGNSNLGGENIFDTLNFTPGRTYTFGINSTLTINRQFNASGTCYEPIRMLSDTNGVQSTIVKHNGAFIAEYLSLRDMKAQGATPFIASNSVDLGNNTNWTIQTSTGKDLYWVNGEGSWSDPDHWDVASGGSGGHCPPTEHDNAIFDHNSFNNSNQVVMIDVMSAVCRDMNWENSGAFDPILSGPDSTRILIYGSLLFNQAMTNDFLGMVFFEAFEPGKLIVSAAKSYNNHIWFNGRDGEWLIQDMLKTDSIIFFQQGSLQTLGNTLDCLRFSSTDTTSRYLNLSTSTIRLKDDATEVWNLNGQNLILRADSSLLQSFGMDGDIVNFNSGNQTLVFNNVEFLGPQSSLLHYEAYCVYNNVKFYQANSSVQGDCTIDSLFFYQHNGNVISSDTIGTAIFYESGGVVQGAHVIGIAYFYGNASVNGSNEIDTALFFRNALIEGINSIDTMIVYNRAAIHGDNTIRTATLLGEGHFYGSNIFMDLTLTKANSYYFEHDKTQTIVDNLSLQGACTGFINLQSDENTIQATLHKVNGGISGDYLLLRDMKATGNQLPFYASNSVDLGNNEGWEITMGEPKDLYWVNGTGVWSDSLHWSGVSGGAGGYCIPTPIDNVFFDQNSFTSPGDIVTVNLADATCRNMNWTGATGLPSFAGYETTNLRIYGSLTLNENLQNNFYGPLFFEATNPGHTIESKGVQILGTVTFQGIGGEWSLVDDFDATGAVFLKRGKLSLAQKILLCRTFFSNFIYPRQLDISQSRVIVSGENENAWHISTINLQFSSDQSTIVSLSTNGLLRTEGGGSISYNKVFHEGSESRVYNINTRASYNSIIFLNSGSVHGNCNIDTLIIGGSGSVYDSDSINYVSFLGQVGNVIGGQHVINTLLFAEHGNISGNNVIDTTIIYGQGNISGMNNISKNLLIGQMATISGQNELGNTVLMGNGDINGLNRFKSLRLTPGNIYELEPNIDQIITDHFHVRGNNCFPITLRSKLQGQQAGISLPAGKLVSGDFIELRDMKATGGATFYAGNFSTNISNNTGWIFSNAPGYIFGFPADTTVCINDLTIIGTQSFNPDENSTFLWHDGSNEDGYIVKPGDTIAWVIVTYAAGCTYNDTILISQMPHPFIDLGSDLITCSLDTIFPFQHSENVSYRWHDGSANPYIIANVSGTYGLSVTNEFGCSAFDQVFVNVIPIPDVSLGNDTTIRAGDHLVLDAGNPGAIYSWSTGETTRTIIGASDQNYWVRVEKDGCFAYDTISIAEYPPCALAVPSAFSPNGDGVNDILYVRGSNFIEFELMIFSRWGEMVFQTKNAANGWDGTYKDKPMPVDAYSYFLRGICIDGQRLTSKGTITLLR